MRSIVRLLLLLALPLAPAAADWPQYRGPERDGRSAETGLRAAWPESGPPVLWRRPLGAGYSSIAVSGGRLYTMLAEGADEFVICLEAADGQEVWRQRVDETWKDMWGNGPRSTPSVHDGTVYAVGGRGVLVALDAENGARRWRHDLWKEYAAKPPQWGVAGSPLVEGQLVLVAAGGEGGASLVAFDRESGKEVWRAQDDRAGYSSPLPITVAGVRQVVFFTATRLVAVVPATGAVLWTHEWKTSYDVNAAMPVFVAPDRLFVSSGYDVGGEMLRLVKGDGGFELQSLWKSREMRNKFSSSVLHEGRLYGFDEKLLKCIDAATGELLWREKGLGHGSLLVADGKLILLSDSGELVLARATPEKYTELARTRVLRGRSWTLPALLDGKLYLRDERELVVLKLSD